MGLPMLYFEGDIWAVETVQVYTFLCFHGVILEEGRWRKRLLFGFG